MHLETLQYRQSAMPTRVQSLTFFCATPFLWEKGPWSATRKMDAPQLAIPCLKRGCNRKYKTADQIALHLRERHGKDAMDMEALVAAAPKVPTKPRNRVKTPPIPIPTVVAAAECCVCYEQSAEGAAATPCGHAGFCYACLKGCFDKGQPCPFCRGEMISVLKLY